MTLSSFFKLGLDRNCLFPLANLHLNQTGKIIGKICVQLIKLSDLNSYFLLGSWKILVLFEKISFLFCPKHLYHLFRLISIIVFNAAYLGLIYVLSTPQKLG